LRRYNVAAAQKVTVMGIKVIAIFVLLTPGVFAQSQTSEQRNLQTCLSGRYPALCNHSSLSAEQLQQAQAAEIRENLKTCMTGRYPALCDHSKLTSEQLNSVRGSETRENLTLCLSGRYPALCNHSLLSSSESLQVRAAERAQNLKVCMDGHYPSLCNHSLLTTEEAGVVGLAETRVSQANPSAPADSTGRSANARQRGKCESGLSIESVEGDGKVIKLDDGSLWEVDDVDTVDTSLWLPPSEVVLCDGRMINTDENESADVTPIRQGRSRGTETRSLSNSGYAIEASANDETFVINAEVFKAKTYCFNFDKGDRVKFIDGSPLGACASATLLNLRTGKVCEVWCE
jgi:hypothetical protein